LVLIYLFFGIFFSFLYLLESVDIQDLPAPSPAPSAALESQGQVSEARWASSLDVGYYAKIPVSEIDKATLQRLLENPWVPPPSYDFPFSVRQSNGKERRCYVGHQHLQKYNWLAFSDMDKGLYCRYCPFFVVGRSGGRGRASLGYLVTKPLTKFSKLFGAKEDLESHAACDYHTAAVLDAKEFLRSRGRTDVSSQLDTYHSRLVKENRERLMCSVENVVFLGRQGLALRGHRESTVNSCQTDMNRGNFLELMTFRKECGDTRVAQHLETAGKRNLYQSKVIQNDIIQGCGEEIVATIMERISTTKYYSILFDETPDINHLSQLSLSVRYSHFDETMKKHVVREDFLRFVDARQVLEEMQVREYDDARDPDDVEDEDDDGVDAETEDIEQSLTGVNLGKVVVQCMLRIGLNPNYCVGIGADGCSVNTSENVGAIQEIQKNCCKCG